jgi:hypothetical protein
MAMAPEQTGIGIHRHFTSEGVHPYDEVTWEQRDSRITNFRDGSTAFEQLGVELPSTWSLNATNIVTQKYFRGTLGTPERESSLKQVIDRVADTITTWGIEGGYFVDDREAETYRAELKHLLVHQKAAFNSPVWFNIGVKGVPQQASACFILSTSSSLVPEASVYSEFGNFCFNSCIIPGRWCIANVPDAVPIRRRPYSAPATSAISASAESCSRSIFLARSSKYSPASVNITRRGVRVNSCRPTSSSSWRICIEIAACVTFTRRAPAVKVFASAIARKAFSCLISIRNPSCG